MSQPQSFTCHNCGYVLSTSGGRCPQCGAEQPEAVATGPSDAAIVGTPVRSRAAPPRRRASALVLPGGAALVLLGAAGFFAYWFGLRQPPGATTVPAPSASTVTDPGSTRFRVDAGAFTPSAVLLQAKTRARAWHPDALLVSFAFGPVVAGRVDLGQQGRFEVLYGRPAGGRLGPGAPVGAAQLAVIVDAEGTRTEERTVEPPARAVAEPNCTFTQAWRAVTAAGLPESSPVSIRYAHDAKHERGVWTAAPVTDPDPSHRVDGRSCNLLVR